ncbi:MULTISPECIES: hypothetical protein [unclassified Streptomyces]
MRAPGRHDDAGLVVLAGQVAATGGVMAEGRVFPGVVPTAASDARW